MNSADKAIRILLAIVVAILYFTGAISGITAIVLGIIAAILVAAVFINFCPVYHILGISTKEKSINKKVK